MPRPGPRRKMTGVRLTDKERDELREQALREGLKGHKGEPNLSELIRILMAYGRRYMPPGWRPE